MTIKTNRTLELPRKHIEVLAAAPDQMEPAIHPQEPVAKRPAGPPLANGQVTMAVASLKPNTVNGEVFSASLGEPAIASLAEDMSRRGLLQPVVVRADKVILDGQRRWLAAKHLGWKEIAVTIQDVGDDAIEAYVLDSYAANRDATVEERVNVFELARRVLKARHGRPTGRPQKGVQSCVDFWDKERIGKEAARKAGFSSSRVAEYAQKVFAEGDAKLRAEVNEGSVSISAAHDKLTPTKPKETETVSPATADDDDGTETPDVGATSKKPRAAASVAKGPQSVLPVEDDAPVAPAVKKAARAAGPDASAPAKPMDSNQATAVMQDFCRREGAEPTRLLIEVLAKEAGLDVLVVDAEPRVATGKAAILLQKNLASFAQDAPELADRWWDSYSKKIQELLSRHKPDEKLRAS